MLLHLSVIFLYFNLTFWHCVLLSWACLSCGCYVFYVFFHSIWRCEGDLSELCFLYILQHTGKRERERGHPGTINEVDTRSTRSSICSWTLQSWPIISNSFICQYSGTCCELYNTTIPQGNWLLDENVFNESVGSFGTRTNLANALNLLSPFGTPFTRI